MEKLELNFKNFKLQGCCWVIDNPTANIILMEGMEEHAQRYDYFAKELNKNGYSVFGLDVFGQGKNILPDGSNKGLWHKNAFFDMVDAYNQLVLKLKEQGKPIFVFAHSMGSFMLQCFLQKYSENIDKAVLCGSGSKNPALGIGYIIAKVASRKSHYDKKAKLLNNLMFGSFNKKIKNTRTDYDWLSYNQENVDNYIADPLCGYGPRNGFCLEFIKGMKSLYSSKGLDNIRKDIPIFIISGREDPVTNYSKDVQVLEKMYKSHGINNISTKIYDKARHEILNEDIKDSVILDILNFYK